MSYFICFFICNLKFCIHIFEFHRKQICVKNQIKKLQTKTLICFEYSRAKFFFAYATSFEYFDFLFNGENEKKIHLNKVMDIIEKNYFLFHTQKLLNHWVAWMSNKFG
jgi:hypothetical protein